ncbi:MAG: L-aspartate oxidase [Flavobacteriaceae bacterium]
MIKTDFLVIGSGIAGLSYALRVGQYFKDQSVLVITKSDESESNTKYAQGGIATVLNGKSDSFDQHIEDTLIAGDGLCDPEVVKMVVEEGPQRLEELINWGVQFDENPEGGYNLGMEGGHSQHRILHHKDITGYEIERALLAAIDKQDNITILEQHFAIDFITEHQTQRTNPNRYDNIHCYGVYALDIANQKVKTIGAKVTMLAAGGSGQIYRNTTNPLIATSDGLAMAYRAKAKISEVEFVQFHPTSLFQEPKESPSFLISEAVRGFGARLRDPDGNLFMHLYDPREELASRDIVARAIDTELKKTGATHLFLDCTDLDYEAFTEHFPNITEKCSSIGIDIRKDFIPVVPAAHYLCGGIKVDQSGLTSIKNLYACGECTRTGLHGANRLASNSLLEALVYSYNSFEAVKNKFDQIPEIPELPQWDASNTSENKEEILITHDRKEVQRIMSDYVGIVRSNARLKRASNRLSILFQENSEFYKEAKISLPLCELQNLITAASLITEFSMNRKENKGGFYNKDLT